MPLVTTWIEGIMLSEISQREKGEYCMMSSICRIYKTKPMKQAQQNRNRVIDTENNRCWPGERGWEEEKK